MTTYHDDLTNHATDSNYKNLHLPGYSVADATARGNITTEVAGDLCYQQDTDEYYLYDGASWVLIGNSAALGIAATRVTIEKFLNLGTPSELTIASGAITVTQSNHRVDTESDASSDDLNTINGGSDEDILVLRAEDSARTVVVKNYVSGGDNIYLAGSDFSLDHIADRLVLMYDSTQSGWVELSRSSNL